MKISLIREKVFVLSSRVDEIITNQYIARSLIRKESHSKNCEILNFTSVIKF